MQRRIATLRERSDTDHLNLRLADLEPCLPVVDASWEHRHCHIVLTIFSRPASNRRSPMYHLLDADELGLFHRWAEQRQREIGRHLTGTLDFHNLRHSFVTLTTVRLLGTQVRWRNEPRDDLPPWQALFQVAALAGHIDPQETVNTYCHGLDLLLQGYLMAAALADPAFIARVEAVYGTSSRSAAHLEISTADEVDSLREVLRVAGIDRARLVATVLSIPRKNGKAEFRRELVRRLEMPQRPIGFAEPLRRRHQGATFGRVALKLAPAGGRAGRSPYGWKVGLFYALVGYCAKSGGPGRDRRDARGRGQAARPLDR